MPSILDGIDNKNSLKQPTKPKVSLRGFDDADAVKDLIYSNVLKAAKTLEPISNAKHTLKLSNVRYENIKDYSLADQKKAILEGDSLTNRLKGDWTLHNAIDNSVIDARPNTTIANIPHMTRRGTFIVNGNEYTLSNQMRLKPGIYTREKENGEVESHINIQPGKGISHRYFLDPSTGIFKINIGQSKVPIIPVLRALGASDKELKEAWGAELLAINSGKDDPGVIDKIYSKLVRHATAANSEEKRQTLVKTLLKTELDPEVTRRTLGTPYSNLSKEAIIDTTKKLLQVSRGEVAPDDRDHLAFQTFLGPEDLIAERVSKDKSVMRQLLWKSFIRNNIQHIQPGVLTKQINHAIMGSGLGQPLEEINPSDVFDQMGRVSRLGEGGIGSMDSVPDSSRNVHPSQFNFVDYIRTPESVKAGIDTRLAHGTKKGDDGNLYAAFNDIKTGKVVYKTPQEVSDLVVAFPNELNKDKPLVAAMVNGKTKFVPREDVDYEVPSMEGTFSPLANMIPGKSGTKGQRVAMGSRFLAQALPLLDAESPNVQSTVPGTDYSFEYMYGKQMGAVRTDKAGKVVKITPDAITVKNEDGTVQEHQIYNNHPYNRKTQTHNTPVVKEGDFVKPSQLLAKSTYTDNNGVTALGKNARIAYIPYKGLNYEDAFAISESFAKKMSSIHLYQHEHEWQPNMKKGKKTFISTFPNKYDKEILNKVDDDGVVKQGQLVHFGDPLVLTVQEKDPSYSQIHKARGVSFSDKTLVWDHHDVGEVTDVAKTKKGVVVAVKAYSPMQEGDKLSSRFGGKGVLAKLIPDDEMPVGEDGKPFEVLSNPLGIISRSNPITIIEAALGKIAAVTGKKYKLEDFKNIEDLTQYAMDELNKHGMKDLETITDPKSGTKIPNVFTGSNFMLKLHHTSASKGQGRGIGSYTAEQTPAKGGQDGSKRLSLLDSTALLSHSGTEVLRDASAIRGQRNDEYWQMFMSGFRPPEPTVPLVYRKFVANLQASGINPVRKGGQVHIMALTNKDVNKLAGNRFIQNANTVDWKEGLRPIKGGLFDPVLTGGHGSESKWAAIKLFEPMPNPVFEEPIRRLLGLTQKQLEEVIAGKKGIGQSGQTYIPSKEDDLFGYGTGPDGLFKALKSIKLDSAISQAQAEIKGSKKTIRDAAIRKLGYLKAAKRLNIHPSEWMLNAVPVLPPIFRPVSVLSGTKAQMVADSNYLYKELFDANSNLEALSKHVDDVSEERLSVYNAFKGVTGLGDPIQPKNQERKVQGILKSVFGNAPKHSQVQRSLLGSSVDLVGRAVITPNPDLDMDHVGLPETMAWRVYTPFIVRRLVRNGMPRLQAAKAVKDQSAIARKAMLDEMSDRPVIINRAPVLHKFGIMASWPILTKGDVLQISPIVTKGFGADFDGDAMQYHVPATDEARDEAIHKMMPSKNLISPSGFKAHYLPSMEFIGGLHKSSTGKDNKKKTRTFASMKDVVNAYKSGEIAIDQPVEIIKH